MKVSYRGLNNDLSPTQQTKLDTRFAKLSKMVDGRGEKQAHVVVAKERHMHKAEVTVRVRDHQMVGIASDSDLFVALAAALAKVEKQVQHQVEKWRSTTRRPVSRKGVPSAPPPAETASRKALAKAPAGSPRVFQVSGQRRKPITLDEAVLQMEDGRDYLVYRDAGKETVHVLVRRRDGHFDLIES